LEEIQNSGEKLLEVSSRTLGEENLDTLSSMHNLAATFKKLGGRLKEVQELEEKVLEVRRSTLEFQYVWFVCGYVEAPVKPGKAPTKSIYYRAK
jgi:hypothetical protein